MLHVTLLSVQKIFCVIMNFSLNMIMKYFCYVHVLGAYPGWCISEHIFDWSLLHCHCRSSLLWVCCYYL